MDELKSIQAELRKLDDLVDTVEAKIHNLAGLLELMDLGIRTINKTEDSYELSSMNIIRDYLKAIEKTDMPLLHEKLASLQEKS